jgi:hypothetical protein
VLKKENTGVIASLSSQCGGDPFATPTREFFVSENRRCSSLEVLAGCRLEPSLKDAQPCDKFQFERKGYFFVGPNGAPVFNRTVTLRDTWAKIKQGAKNKTSS